MLVVLCWCCQKQVFGIKPWLRFDLYSVTRLPQRSIRTRYPTHLGPSPYVLQQITRYSAKKTNDAKEHQGKRFSGTSFHCTPRVSAAKFISGTTKGQETAPTDPSYQMLKIFHKETFVNISEANGSHYSRSVFCFLKLTEYCRQKVSMLFTPRN